MAFMLMAANTFRDGIGWPTHVGRIRQQLEAVRHFVFIQTGLSHAELTDAIKKYFENFRFGPFRQAVSIHLDFPVLTRSVPLPRKFHRRYGCQHR